jgi:SAM-dependent methyltransferase
MVHETTWTQYYEQNDDRAPREMLLEVLDTFGPRAGQAVDLGCGAGIDTVAMLERGWRVFATDQGDEGIERLLRRLPAELQSGLTTRVVPMEAVELPPADLVWAGYSLFFCDADRFADVWGRVRAAVRPDGRFAGQLLGDRDTWAPDDGISSFTEDAARDLFDGWTIESFEEEDEDGEACSGPKHWHVFHVVARSAGTESSQGRRP